jgi:hypothetical protein
MWEPAEKPCIRSPCTRNGGRCVRGRQRAGPSGGPQGEAHGGSPKDLGCHYLPARSAAAGPFAWPRVRLKNADLPSDRPEAAKSACDGEVGIRSPCLRNGCRRVDTICLRRDKQGRVGGSPKDMEIPSGRRAIPRWLRCQWDVQMMPYGRRMWAMCARARH